MYDQRCERSCLRHAPVGRGDDADQVRWGRGREMRKEIKSLKIVEEKIKSKGVAVIEKNTTLLPLTDKECPKCENKTVARLPRKCEKCGVVTKPKDTKNCPECKTPLPKMVEEEGTIWATHITKRAMRKMIKLFLSHLWLVWRAAEGLSVTSPYPIAVLGHKDFISPEEMIDKPAKVKKERGKKKGK